jgi:hypothetical protein
MSEVAMSRQRSQSLSSCARRIVPATRGIVNVLLPPRQSWGSPWVISVAHHPYSCAPRRKRDPDASAGEPPAFGKIVEDHTGDEPPCCKQHARKRGCPANGMGRLLAFSKTGNPVPCGRRCAMSRASMSAFKRAERVQCRCNSTQFSAEPLARDMH